MALVVPYLLLTCAILSEILGTSMLQKSEQFTRLGPTLLMALAYALSFWLLSQVLRTIPLGIAYAIWGGVGIVFVALIGRFVFGQVIDAAGMIGIALIVGGVVVINVFSGSATH